MHGEDFQPAVQGVTCPASVNNSNCAYNFLCVALKIHPTDFSSMSSNSAAIYYILRVETRTLKLQDGSGCLCSPPFLTFSSVSIRWREALRTRSSGGVHLQRMHGLLWWWLPVPSLGSAGLVSVHVGVSGCLPADRLLWTLVSPLGTLQRPGSSSPCVGGLWRKRRAALWRRAHTRRRQNRGELAAPTQ